MSRTVALLGLFLLLSFSPALSDTASGIMANPGQSAAVQTAPASPANSAGAQKSASKSSAVLSTTDTREVINIWVDRVESNCIYAKDGRSFEFNNATRVIRNIHPESAQRTAELVFINKTLVTVTIR